MSRGCYRPSTIRIWWRPIHASRRHLGSSSRTRTYNDAIDLLNTLQTPHAVQQARAKAGTRPDAPYLAEMRSCLARIGYSSQDLDRLNILHVAGTKGKGTTCAYTDSILSRCRLARGVPSKVGLFTSPHLVSVRERIRINSEPVSEELFARYFFEVWDRLEASHPPSPPPRSPSSGLTEDGKEEEEAPDPRRWHAGSIDGKPIYGRYLTLMSWHLFLHEGVDVAIYETGIGGEFDATNVVDRPVAAAITTLGVDHVFALGNTVAKIAWHKAGIMKPGRPAFTIDQGLPSADAVLQARAAEKGADLHVLPVDPRLDLGGADGSRRPVALRPDADFQRKNATLAVALAEEALRAVDPGFREPDRSAPLPRDFVEGLEQVVWRGRCEVKEEEEVRWYIDGAHTFDSLKLAGRWFAGEIDKKKGGPKQSESESGGDSGDSDGPRVLIFNQQGRPEATDFLAPFCEATRSVDGKGFDEVIFCSNTTYASGNSKRDFVNHTVDASEVGKLTVQSAFAKKWSQLDPSARVLVVPSIEDAINRVRELASSEGRQAQALVTGSLHLVGGVLGILEGGVETL